MRERGRERERGGGGGGGGRTNVYNPNAHSAFKIEVNVTA